MDMDESAALVAVRAAFSTEGKVVPTKHFSEMLQERHLSMDDVRRAVSLGRIDRIDRTAGGSQTFRLIGPTCEESLREEVAVVFGLRNGPKAILITCYPIGAPPRRT
jgi:hypothetical protein